MITYFKNLYALRFFGAFSVILGHIELIKSMEHVPNLMSLPFYKFTNGHIGVLLFFVLSGFLITYFLIQELEQKMTINIRAFYMKRILRIWPIYYLMLLFSVFVLPTILSFIDGSKIQVHNSETLFYWFFLPNVAKSLQHYFPGLTHLWSIGVEEQFYLIWPLLLLFTRKKIILSCLVVILLFSFVVPFIDFIHFRTDFFLFHPNFKGFLSAFLGGFKINSMAIGGLFALFYSKKSYFFTILYSTYIEPIVVIFTLWCWISGIHFGTYTDEVYSILFGVLIFILATKPSAFFTMENKFFIFFGQISYGLYVYHWVIILITIKLLKKYWILSSISFNISLYVISIGITILIAYLSFKCIEGPILKFKKIFIKTTL